MSYQGKFSGKKQPEKKPNPIDTPQEPKSGKGRVVLLVLAIVLVLAALGCGALFLLSSPPEEAGPELVAVPNLVGQEYETLSQELPVRVVASGESYSDAYAAGRILEQSIAPDTQVEPDTVVAVMISLGSKAEEKTMPALTGMTRSQAEQILQELNIALNIAVEESYQAEGAKDSVLRTDPEADTVLRKGDTVSLYVSKGNLSQVPGVTGLDQAEAVTRLKAAGYENVGTVEVPSSEPQGKVLTQSVAADQEARITVRIVLRVSSGVAQAETTAPETEPEETEPATEPTKPEATQPQQTEPTQPTEGTEATEPTQAPTQETTEATEATQETEATQATTEATQAPEDPTDTGVVG